MAQRRRKIRLTFVERSQDEIAEAFRDHVNQGGVLWDYFCSILADRVHGANEFERGVAEGMRQLADEILTMAISKPAVKVETNQDD